MARTVASDARGIVRPELGLRHFELRRWPVDPPLDRFVDRWWQTRWDLVEPFDQPLVLHPAASLVFEPDGTATVGGVSRLEFVRRIEGTGWAFGVLFRAAGLRPFIDVPMHTLADRAVPIEAVFGAAGRELADDVARSVDADERRGRVAQFLGERAPIGGTEGEPISGLVDRLAAGAGSAMRVAALADELGVSTRTLQRLFAEHVGVGPKWVEQRCRLQAVAEQARRPVASWADVAQQFGFADQSHLTTVFAEAFGAPPAQYAQSCAGDSRLARSSP